MGITIRTLKLRNWKCYRGETELALADRAYAISAKDGRDTGRSNWLGKSSLTEAVEFALHGTLPRSVKDRPKTSWISRGENAGEVEVVLSNGARIVRSQSMKGSERLFLYPDVDQIRHVGDGGAIQDEAQAWIDRILGVGASDWATWAFRQGSMSQMLRMESGKLEAAFSEWLRLGKLEECEGTASVALTELNRVVAAARAEEKAADLARERLLAQSGCQTQELLKEEFERACMRASEIATRIEVLVAEHAREAAWTALEPDAERYDQIVKDGQALKERLDGYLPAEELKAKAEATTRAVLLAREAEAVAVNAYRSAAALVTNGFDGRCPYLGAACPSATEVANAVGHHHAEATKARAAVEEVTGEKNRLAHLDAAAFQALRDRERVEVQIQTLRGQARALSNAKKVVEAGRASGVDGSATATALLKAREDHAEASRRVNDLAGFLNSIRSAEQQKADARAKADRASAAANVARAGVMVFDRSRRRIAEAVFGEVEERARGLLALGGIDLDVRFSWGREGRGLADACSECGILLPKSQKVKECPVCKAERGAKMVDRLDVEVRGLPSASGAADDLGGLVLQLATARWLREDRGTEWATAILDEPFGQLDASNRRALSGAMGRMLGACGYMQAFVIAHHDGVLDAMPGRIEVVADGPWSTACVVG